ncbi:MAG: alanine--glyoxylate aminotransferase family protein [Lachnospiraceae bacterium]
MYKIMTPGPTQVKENVRMARSLECTNPDLDDKFVTFYKETCEQISSLLHTQNETLILDGEGILGLEASCASLTEQGDPVLVLDNGIYGKGFADFVSMYGGIPTLYTVEDKNPIDPIALEEYLKENNHFKYATLVHCDTPSGMLNEIDRICPILKKYGIITVVDSVSAMFGEEVCVDQYGIDILCGGSQKAVSAPPGLTFVVISKDAKKAMKERKTPIASFYANLQIFEGYYEKKWFPYTMPISDIYGLRIAFDNIAADKDMLVRHRTIGRACRNTVIKAGLSLYLESGYSNTVTVIKVPKGLTAQDILERMKKEHNIMLAGSFDAMEGKVIRIGHMGTNANVCDMTQTLEALGETIEALGMKLKCQMGKEFLMEYSVQMGKSSL